MSPPLVCKAVPDINFNVNVNFFDNLTPSCKVNLEVPALYV